jgi:signal transduction histidine kinase
LLTKKVRLETSLAPGLPLAQGDPQELRQVFINLINNARDAMTGGGLLKVSTNLTPDGNRLAIEFTDTGNGIPREAQAKIFDPFFTTKETGKGTGLGLSMSYGIIIMFTSFPADEYPEKHGTTFTVYLPIITGPEAEAAGPEGQAEPAAAVHNG